MYQTSLHPTGGAANPLSRSRRNCRRLQGDAKLPAAVPRFVRGIYAFTAFADFLTTPSTHAAGRAQRACTRGPGKFIFKPLIFGNILSRLTALILFTGDTHLNWKAS
jgi:hypothetical protein